jgi:hypothetical protein
MSLAYLRKIDNATLIDRPRSPNMLTHVTEKTGGHQVIKTIVGVVVIHMVDFLITLSPETAKSAGIVVSLEGLLADIFEGSIRTFRRVVVLTPIARLHRQYDRQKFFRHYSSPLRDQDSLAP